MPANQTQRPKFYEEQYLGAADLTAAVDYGRVQHSRHVLGGHTWGIAIGLQLKETTHAGGAVSVHLLPGYAWDGYGRPIVVLSPYRVPEELFSAIKFDPVIDGAGKGRLIPLWIRYDEAATQKPPAGFEACDGSGQFSRIQESFRVVIGEQSNPTDRYSGVNVGGRMLTDAKTALRAFDAAGPFIYDESIPHQNFPEGQDAARWLIPIGYARWLPVQNQPGHFVARDDSGPEKDSEKIRQFRTRYVGLVAEAIEAADGAIRLRDRAKDPTAGFFQPATREQIANSTNDLVWVEGNLRVAGNVKLCAGKLDLRDQEGKDFDVPLLLQRTGDGSFGGRALQAVIGSDAQTNTRFAVGPVKAADKTVDEKFTVLSNGHVGIGTGNPSQMFTLQVPEGNRLEIGKTSAALPWSPALAVRPGAFVINQQSAGSSEPGADFALMRDRKKRLMLLDNDTVLSSHNSGSVRFFVNHDEPAGSREAMTVSGAGAVGIGTANPTHAFHVLAQDAVGLFESSGNEAYLRLMTREGIDKRVEITNRPGGRFSVWTLAGGDSFNVTQAGNVGIGTTVPQTKVHVLGNRIRLENFNKRVDLRADGSAVDLHSETNHLYVRSSGPGGNNNVIINPFATDGNVGIGTQTPAHKLQVNGQAAKTTGLYWTTVSDERLKTKIQPIDNALDRLLQLRGVSYEWREPGNFGNATGSQMGLVAQDVEKVFPQWVSTDASGYKNLSVQGLEALTIEALRELRDEIERLKKRLETIDARAPERVRRRRRAKEKQNEGTD